MISTSDFVHYGDLFRGLIASEYRRLPPENRVKVKGFLLEYIHETTLSGFFVAARISRLRERIFGDSVIQTFILGLTYRFSIMVATSDNEPTELVTTIMTGLNRALGEYSSSLIPEPIYRNLDIDKVETEKTLLNNFWLVTMVLVYLFDLHLEDSPA